MCDPVIGPGGPYCSRVYVPNVLQSCSGNSTNICEAAAGLALNATGTEGPGGGWGIFVSIACDILISLGLALQVRYLQGPVAHFSGRVSEMCSWPAAAALSQADSAG